MPSDTDLERGYTISEGGIITLLRPLNFEQLNYLFDHFPKQLASLQTQQVELEISQPPKPDQHSRASNTTNGYIFLVAWSNACLLRILMTKWFRWYRGIYRNLKDFTAESSKFPYNPLNSPNFTPVRLNLKLLDRLEAQLLDALRSVVANIEEGYARPTTGEYLEFLGFSQASLKEGKGDIHRMRQDGLIIGRPGSSLADSIIDLSAWHSALKKSVVSRPDRSFPQSVSIRNSYNFLQYPINSSKFNYPPVDNFDPAFLTFEILIELVNKTDWQLRRLVESLEHKLSVDKKDYQIDRARIGFNLRWRP